MPTTFEVLSPDGAPKFVACLPNERGKGRPHQQYVCNDTELQKFLATRDVPGYALYHTVCVLKDGAPRNKENVDRTWFVWGEVDYKDHPDLAPAEIVRRLDAIPLRPTFCVFSGHGIHPYWMLKEPENASPGEGQRRIEEVLRLICNYIGGDPHVAETARLMRLPGSHNTRKPGECLPVTFQDVDMNRRYDLGELTDFLLEAHPIISAPVSVAQNDKSPAPADTMAATDKLAHMSYKGRIPLNPTQLSATASMLSAGKTVAEVTSHILEVTKGAAGNDGASWDWEEEEKQIRSMCLRWVNKRYAGGEDLGHCLPDNLYAKWREAIEGGRRPVLAENGAGWHVRSYNDSSGNIVDGVINIADGNNNNEAPQNDIPNAPFILRPFEPFDVTLLPQREFLFGRHYQRRVVSGTVAPGGTGKSSEVMCEFVSMATGRNLLDEVVRERQRVWYHNGEDNMLELQRRLAGICQQYSIPMEELRGWFFMTSGNELPLRVAESWNQVRLNTDHRLVKCIAEQIGDNRITAAAFDPLVTLHGAAENNPGQMDQVIRIFANISDTQNCSIDLSHHTRKQPPGGSVDAYELDDMRGAKAVSDAMRMVRILNVMSAKDAEAAGVDEMLRSNYFRIDRAKANYSPPAKKAIWRQFVNVPLANGDEVGVVVPWLFPGQDGAPSPERAEAERRAEHVFLEILRRLFLEGRFVGEHGPENAPYVFAREREARLAKIGKAALDAAMRRLFDKKKIRLEDYVKADRHAGTAAVPPIQHRRTPLRPTRQAGQRTCR